MNDENKALVENLRRLGRNRWGTKEPLITFSHSGGRVHISDVEPFFYAAVRLAEKAADVIEKLDAEPKS